MLRIPSNVRPYVHLGDAQLTYLESLVDEWHVLADLAFSDLVLWVPGMDDHVFFAIAQIRPSTGPTALDEDIVGETITDDTDNPVSAAYRTGIIVESSENSARTGAPVDITAIPLMVGGACWGVLERHTKQLGVRVPGELEDHYLVVADQLSDMVWRGEFANQGFHKFTALAPRVGEGLITLDEAGIVDYASPNAVVTYRKLGLTTDLVGEALVPLTQALVSASSETVDTSLAARFNSPTSEEVEIDNGHTSVMMRVWPLTDARGRLGTMVLMRDTTELRQRERQLVTKDVTIREIHHRVKNNLQTVSALLRLQIRRMKSPEAVEALTEAMARVQAIAVVHEILSRSMSGLVDFDDVADRLLRSASDLAAARGQVITSREGTFGEVPANIATPLSLVMTELCTNAIEHGMNGDSGTLVVRAERSTTGVLKMEVIDDGAGLPEGFQVRDVSRSSLGLSIVTTLLQDLGGKFTLEPNPTGPGARATVVVRLWGNSDRGTGRA